MKYSIQHLKGVALFAAILSLSSCEDKASDEPLPPRPIIVQEVADPLGNEERSFSGVIRASDAATLGFEVPGRITKVIAKAGRSYKKGETLAELDVSNFSSDLRRAKAEALQVNEELKRIQQLFESSNASRAQLDSAIAAQKAATSAVEVAQKKVSDGILKMPYDGVIESVILDEQAVVSAGSQVMTIQGSGAMKIEIGVPTEMISLVQLNMPAKVSFGRLTAAIVNAKVDRVYPQASKNGTYPVSLLLENAGPKIRGGMDAEALMVFPNPRGKTLRVEAAAIVSSPNGETYVWVVNPSESQEVTAKKRPVKIGELREEGEIEILSGLEPGELVVTRGVHQLKEDIVVTLTK